MKRNFVNNGIYLILIFSIGTFSFFSCKKDLSPIPNKNLETENEEISFEGLKSLGINGVTVENGMFKFIDQGHFHAVANALEIANDLHDDKWLLKNKGLSDDELFLKEVESDYDHDYVFSQFEKMHNFNSLRAKYIELEDTWLQDLNADETTYPLHPIIQSKYMALLNENGEVQIGDEISITQLGFFVSFAAREAELLTQIRTESIAPDEIANLVGTKVKVFVEHGISPPGTGKPNPRGGGSGGDDEEDSEGTCRTRKRKQVKNSDRIGDLKYITVASVWKHAALGDCGAIAKTKVFKKHTTLGISYFWRTRKDLQAVCNPKMVDITVAPCEVVQLGITSTGGKKHKVKTVRAGAPCETKSGFVVTGHVGPGYSRINTVEW